MSKNGGDRVRGVMLGDLARQRGIGQAHEDIQQAQTQAEPSDDTISARAQIARQRLAEFEEALSAVGRRLQDRPIYPVPEPGSAGVKGTDPVEQNIADDLNAALQIIRRCQSMVGELHKLLG